MAKLFALTIPTGIGAEVGGYAGDCGAVARKFARHFDLIVNPNVVNGGIMSAITDNMHYVEGWALDEYLCGNLALLPSRGNKIGVIFDCAIPENILNIHINTISAAKTVLGLDILGYDEMSESNLGACTQVCERMKQKAKPYVITASPVGVEFTVEGGISSGNILNPATLLEAGKKLVAQGAEAIAVVCFFPDTDDSEYCAGAGVDPIGGVEGIISHYLSRELHIPTAHSPAFKTLDISENIENPKVASEMISSTYLPCVLIGLNQAPRIEASLTGLPSLPRCASRCQGAPFGVQTSTAHNILPLPDGLIVPSSALGSKGVLGAIKNNIPLYTVANPTQLSVCAHQLGITPARHFESYDEALIYLVEKFPN